MVIATMQEIKDQIKTKSDLHKHQEKVIKELEKLQTQKKLTGSIDKKDLHRIREKLQEAGILTKK